MTTISKDKNYKLTRRDNVKLCTIISSFQAKTYKIYLERTRKTCSHMYICHKQILSVSNNTCLRNYVKKIESRSNTYKKMPLNNIKYQTCVLLVSK